LRTASTSHISRSLSPSKSYVAIVFGNRSSYYRKFPSEYRSSLPFIYYKYRGWNIYPVLTSNLAGASNDSMFLEILDEQKLMVSFRTYRGMKYVVFPMYFDYCGSGAGWLDSFAQGNLAGHYARAYRLTGDPEYLKISDALINSFRAPAGPVKSTKYGNFYLHYNFMRQHYIHPPHMYPGTQEGIHLYREHQGPHALQGGCFNLQGNAPEVRQWPLDLLCRGWGVLQAGLAGK